MKQTSKIHIVTIWTSHFKKHSLFSAEMDLGRLHHFWSITVQQPSHTLQLGCTSLFRWRTTQGQCKHHDPEVLNNFTHSLTHCARMYPLGERALV